MIYRLCNHYISRFVEIKERSSMTFATLLTTLRQFDATAALVFTFDDQSIGAGYHVTELRHSTTTGIDCGGNIETWQETRLQLLDGQGKTHMSVGKFSGILAKSIDKLPELSDAPLVVEFSPNNLGLRLLDLGEPLESDGLVSVALRDSKAICKPAQQNRYPITPRTETKSSPCCAPSSASACCGPETETNQSVACCG